MLIDELQKANIEALKARDNDTRAVLSVVINRYRLQAIEMKTQGKEATDTDLVKIISKVLKELEEEKAGYEKVGNTAQVDAINKQASIIEKYLPTMLSEDKIREIISTLEDKSMPSVMKHFKTNYDGQVDMSLVSKIARGA